MTQTTPLDPDLKLIKQLIGLNGLSNAKAADAMAIQRSNLSSWLNGKPNVFSTKRIDVMLEALGMRAVSDPVSNLSLRYLTPEVVHRWQVEVGAVAFIDVLRATEPESVLAGLKIYRVNAYPRGYFNILRGERQNGDLLMLVANKDPSAKDYPVSVEQLGFGMMAGTIEMPLETWIAWWQEKTLPMPQFSAQISEYLGRVQADEGTDNPQLDSKSKSVEAQLDECQYQVAGLSALIQAFINEMRGMKPPNRLLNKDEQSKIYNEARNREIQKRS